MIERGENGPPDLRGKSGVEGETVINAHERFEKIRRKRHEEAGERLSAQAEHFIDAGKEKLERMDNEDDPRAVERMIFELSDDIVRYATDLDVEAGGRSYENMSERVEEPLEQMPSAVPPGNLGTLPLSVYNIVMNQLQTAREFVEVAIITHDEGREYEGSLNAARDTAWAAVCTLYEGMQALPRHL